jgi:hypothetical protein
MICSKEGLYKNQLMISKWKSGTSKDAIDKASLLVEDMQTAGLKVERIKIEAMAHCEGVPQESSDTFIRENYFEFHIKYKMEYLPILEEVAKKYDCNISFNAFKECLKLILTIRVAGNLGYKQAEKIKDTIIESVKSYGIHTNDSVQREYCIYDTNVDYDRDMIRTLEY